MTICDRCGNFDLDSITFAYTNWEAANLMLGYVNEVRRENGLRELKLCEALIEVAMIQAEDYSDRHITYMPGFATGWYVDGGNSIRHHFEKMVASNATALSRPGYRYMGFGWYYPPNEKAGGQHGAVLFWSQNQYDMYYGLD